MQMGICTTFTLGPAPATTHLLGSTTQVKTHKVPQTLFWANASLMFAHFGCPNFDSVSFVPYYAAGYTIRSDPTIDTARGEIIFGACLCKMDGLGCPFLSYEHRSLHLRRFSFPTAFPQATMGSTLPSWT